MPKDALSQMGLSRRPLFEFFGDSKQVAKDPMYAPAARQAALEDQMIQSNQQAFQMQQRDLRQQQQAQRAVNRYVRQPANTRQQFLEDNPAVALSPQFDNIARYEHTNAMAAANAARTLAPSLARKLPPMGTQRFYSNLDSGMGANEAFEEARDFLEQESYREKLTPVATDDEIKRAFPTGRFSGPEVARFEAEQKRKLGNDPDIDTMQKLYSHLRSQARTQYETTGKVDPELQSSFDDVGRMLKDKLEAKAMKPAAPAPAAGGALPVLKEGEVPPPPAPADKPAATAPAAASMSYMDLLKSASPEAKKQKQETDRINEQWTRAKQDMQKKLDAVVPDKVVGDTGINQREAFARAILDGEEIVVEGIAPVEGAGPVTEPLATAVLRQLGMVPADTAFEEPGNQRTGSQKVNNRELLKAWAEDFLSQRGKLKPIKESPTGGKLTPEQEAAMQRLDKLIRGE